MDIARSITSPGPGPGDGGSAFTVADAVRIAAEAHAGQVDKIGEPYIGHPLRVMERVTGDHARMAAVLHDVLEDTALTADALLEAGCPTEVVSTVVALTHLPGEPRARYLSRVVKDPVAIAVKRADVADNTDPLRTAALAPDVRERLRGKYAATLAFLDSFTRATAELDNFQIDIATR